MKILIVGAGVGGLSAALFLKAKGIDVTVIERAEKLRTIGFLLGFYPNGVRMLKELGVYEKLSSQVHQVPSLILKDGQGKNLSEISFKPIEKRHGPMIEVERETLHGALRKATKDIPIRFNTMVQHVKQDEHQVHVEFTTGVQESFDLVIGADGINSQIRSYVEPKARKKHTGFTTWVFWMKKPQQVSPNAVNYLGNGNYVGVFPCKNKKNVGVLLLAKSKEKREYDQKTGLQELKEYFKDMGDLVPSMMHTLSPQELYYNGDYEMKLSKWHNNRIVLLGDAAHALSPILGIGASLAMEDAYVLAEELAKKQPLGQSLSQYQRRRKSRTDKLAFWSNMGHVLLGARRPFLGIRNVLLKRVYAKIYYNFVNGFLGEPL